MFRFNTIIVFDKVKNEVLKFVIKRWFWTRKTCTMKIGFEIKLYKHFAFWIKIKLIKFLARTSKVIYWK